MNNCNRPCWKMTHSNIPCWKLKQKTGSNQRTNTCHPERTGNAFTRLPTFGHLSSFPPCHPKFRNNGKGNWKQLSEAINSTFPNFLRQLYALYPQLSEHELHICYLIKIELKRSIIAELLNRSVSAITNSLSRLYQKIYSEKGTAQQMEGIIQEL